MLLSVHRPSNQAGQKTETTMKFYLIYSGHYKVTISCKNPAEALEQLKHIFKPRKSKLAMCGIWEMKKEGGFKRNIPLSTIAA
jgi:hypothetical protein